jgi:outer membrane protein assembly factor BamB
MRRRVSFRAVTAQVSAAAFCVTAFAGTTGARAASWPTFDQNPARAAWLDLDRSFTRHNVASLRRKWAITLDAVADSTPIFVEHVPARSGGPMLFQTDREGKTYGIDASNGTVVWKYTTSGPGITNSSPVLDPATGALYVPGVDGYVHKLNAATGAEATAPGFPAQITVIPQTEKDASPLNLANGYLYAATSGYLGDGTPYDGHVVAVRLSDGTTQVFNSLCADLRMLLNGTQCQSQRSGVWGRGGVVVDPDTSMSGHVYFSTGNGPFSAHQHDFGDSVVALSADASTFVGSFTPADNVKLWQDDIDLGSTAPAMLPPVKGTTTQLLGVQGGKGQILYLLNRAKLGGVGGDMQRNQLPAGVFTAPATYRDDMGRTLVIVGLLPESSDVIAFVLGADTKGRPRLKQLWTSSVGGTSPIVVGGVVFIAAGGALTALDSETGKTLWSSTNPSVGGTIGSIHWESPIAVDGGVYVSDGSAALSAYTLNGK